MSVLSVAPYVGAFALQAAQVTAQFAPVPWLAPALGLANSLITMIRGAHANKNSLKQLQDRCIGFLVIVQQKGDGATVLEQEVLLTGAETTIKNVIVRMEKWCSKNAIELFLKQLDLATAIQDCHMEINDSITKLQLTAALDTMTWQAEFQANTERDQTEVLKYLADIKNTQSIIAMTQSQQGANIRSIMELMQQNLPETHNNDTRGLGTNLYRIQKSSGELLANMHLQRGEVCRIGRYPVSGTGSMDIWEGLYLNEEKVAIKILRAVHATPKSLTRFQQEVDIWIRIWNVDRGRHILPLYGFCQNDGPFPYVVSPWQPHGTADKYIVRYPDIDHRALIRGICEGIKVLHTAMDPNIVHGDLKAATVVIDGTGNPLLADFGFSRIVEQITGVPFTQSAGVSNSQRWLAPELCDGEKLLISADIYSLGMTMLEVMTHEQPWARFRHTTQVIINVSRGQRPERPTDEATIARGLDDHLWGIIQSCWGPAAERPTIDQILELL